MKYLNWCRYSIIFQATVFTLAWVYIVTMLAIMEYHGNNTSSTLVVSIALCLLIAGSRITVVWPASLVKKMEHPDYLPSTTLYWWIVVGLIQLPFGLFLAAFQLWCLWQFKQNRLK